MVIHDIITSVVRRRRVAEIKLTERQEEIIRLVKEKQPITSEKLAENLEVSRAALRPDLSILTMSGILDAKPKVGYVYSDKPKKNTVYEHISKFKVRDIMSKPVVVDENTKLNDAVMHLFLNDTGTLFIENKGTLVGAVSRKDFIKFAIGGSDMHTVPVGIIMTRMPNIVIVEQEDLAITAAQKIIEHEVDCLPVVEKNVVEDKEIYKIIGKVSKTTITKLFVKVTN